MSFTKTSTYISVIDSFGEEMSETWVAEKDSLTESFWKDILVTTGAVKYVWNPADWVDFSPTAFSALVMVADGNLDVEMASDGTELQSGGDSTTISVDTAISADTTYQDTVIILFGVTLEIEDGHTVTIESNASYVHSYNSFRLSKNAPFVLYANDMYYNHSASTAAVFGGTLGVINSIRVAEPSSASVNLTMIMSN